MRLKGIREYFLAFILILSILSGTLVFVVGDTNTGSTSGDASSTTLMQKIGNLIGVIGDKILFTEGDKEDTLTFSDGGSVKIGEDIFQNVEEGSSIHLDKSGDITSADLTATKDTSFTFKDIGTYNLMKGQRLEYNDGKATIYGKPGDSLGFKPKLFDSSGKDIGKLSNLKMNGNFLNIEKEGTGEGNIITGNFNLGNNIVKGLDNGNSFGRVTLSKEGRISEIGPGTDALVNNVDFKVSGSNLKIYYDENFNPTEHLGENYFSYKKDTFYVGGNGYTTDLTKSTGIFGDMQTSKEVKGIGTKTRNLEITMNDGNLVVSKDLNAGSGDLAFKVNGKGSYVIDDGRNAIYSERMPVLAGQTSSEENQIFIKTHEDSEGLLYSYNLNINNGEYTLKDNLFENSAGEVLVNTNKPWENLVYVAKNLDSREARDIELQMEQSGKLIFVDEPNFMTWIKGDGGEAIMKELYTGTESGTCFKSCLQ